MNKSENRTELKSRITLIFFGKIFQFNKKLVALLIFFSTAIFFLVEKKINFQLFDLMKIISILAIYFFISKLLNYADNIYYDDNAIFWKKITFRAHLLPIVIFEKSLRYADIDRMLLNMGELYISPFSDLELYEVGHRWGEKATLILARGTFSDDDFRVFLQRMYVACSDKYPVELVTFMNNE